MTDQQTNILKAFANYLKLKSISTQRYYLYNVKEYFSYLNSYHKSFFQVSKTAGESYRSYLLSAENRQYSRSTINNKLNHLRSFYRFLLKKNLVSFNPFHNLEGLKAAYTVPKDILSIDDMGKLLTGFQQKNYIDIMVKSVIELLYGSGLRVSEAADLKISDIDFTGNYLVIHDKKAGRKRKVPATENSLQAVRSYLKTARNKLVSAESNFLYPQQSTSSLRCLVNSKLKKECRRLGLKVITTHSFRHSAGTHLLRSGAGIREIQAFLGHKSITTTQIYTRVVKDDLKNLIKGFHPREQED